MYDEQDAIAYIRRSLGPGADPATADDDQLLNIIDIVWDWQEANGYLEIDADDADEPIDIDALTDHALRLLRKDSGNRITDPRTVRAVIAAELEFEESL